MARRLHHNHHLSHLRSRAAVAIADPEPLQLKAIVETPLNQFETLFVRDVSESSSDSSGSSSDSKDKPSGGSNISLPVALGVIIPVALGVIIFVYLHRRHVKKLRQEDANDPHKSLDFGWDPANNIQGKSRGKGRKKKSEMVDTDIGMDKGSKRERGVSMDMDVGSPYLLPPGLQGSRESLNSMSRTIQSHDDRYRPAITSGPNDSSSIHSHNTRRAGDDMQQNLLGNAQRISRSMPPVNRTPVPRIQVPEPALEVPRKAIPSTPTTPTSTGLSAKAPLLGGRDSYQIGDDMRRSNNYLGAFIHSREPSAEIASPKSERSEYATPMEMHASPLVNPQQTNSRKSPPPAISATIDNARPLRQQSLRASAQASIEHNFLDDSSDYGEGARVTAPSSHASLQSNHGPTRGSSQEYMPPINEYGLGVSESDFGYEVRRLSTGVRPLPHDDPTDNPEQRANRIRSFYKEYFDDSKPAPAAAQYYEDYDENYLDDHPVWDPSSDHPPMPGAPPYAEPYSRRAMTPPPRIAGRRHAATMSISSHLMPPSPRAFSTTSGGSAPSGRAPPKRKLPPPVSLRVLPTPHLLKEDAFALPIDFAPPTSARDRQAGRPESPRGGMRPFSPAVRPHTPLARSYDDLAVMPSPHLLRKSGTFTALDFAPPPRFKNSDTASDAGSIRSNRSAMSARSQQAVRNGAYRVSRIPKGIVGTKNELVDSLKPQWNMHNNTGTIGMPT